MGMIENTTTIAGQTFKAYQGDFNAVRSLVQAFLDLQGWGQVADADDDFWGLSSDEWVVTTPEGVNAIIDTTDNSVFTIGGQS